MCGSGRLSALARREQAPISLQAHQPPRAVVDQATCAVRQLIPSTSTHNPRQISESSSFADELYAEQYAEQPERGDWEAGPQKKRQQYPNDAACQNPTPVRKRPYCQSKNQF